MVLPKLTPVDLLVAAVTALLGYTGLASPLFGTRHARYSALVATAASVAASALLYRLAVERGPLHLFHGSMVVDGFGALLVFASSLSLFFDIVAAVSVVERWDTGSAFYAISALTLLGVYTVALGVNLALIYAAWILAAVSSYVIIALWKNDVAAEAAAKYAVMGVISTSLLIYALTFAVGAAGSIYYTSVKPVALVVAGAAVLLPLAAVGFKMGVVPFHMWLPDVYGNARPFLVSVVASQAKLIAVAFLVRLLYPMAVAHPGLVHVLAGILAAATMTLGNVAALAANDARLVMAYSAIGQAGYIVAGLAALRPGLEDIVLAGLVLQAAGYALSKTSAFLVLDVVYERSGWGEKSLDVIRGLGRVSPANAAALLLALLVLVGMPPSLGFWGKLLILEGVAKIDLALAILFVVNLAVAAFYYMRLAWRLYSEDVRAPRVGSDWRTVAALAASLAAFALGFAYPLVSNAFIWATPPAP